MSRKNKLLLYPINVMLQVFLKYTPLLAIYTVFGFEADISTRASLDMQ